MTEIYDYLPFLYARIGIPPLSGLRREIKQQTVDQIVDKVLELSEGTRIQVMAPVVRARKGTHQKEFEAARKSGYVRVRVDGNIYDLGRDQPGKKQKHTIEIIVDRLVIKEGVRSRLADSIETAGGVDRRDWQSSMSLVAKRSCFRKITPAQNITLASMSFLLGCFPSIIPLAHVKSVPDLVPF